MDGALGNLRVHLRVRYVNCYSGLRAHNLPQVPNVAVVIRETAFAVALRLCLSVTGHLIEKGGRVELVFDTQRFSSTYNTRLSMEIRVYPKLTVLSSGTFPKLLILTENFATAHLIRQR